MSKQLTTQKAFKQDIAEYQALEKDIATNFLNGVVQLGEVLYRARETWKPQERWREYLTTIGRTPVHANQMIRLYEYSKTNMKELVQSGIDNWTKANMLLALPEELRTELSNQVDAEGTAKEFKEKVDEIKEENLIDVEIVEDDDLFGLEMTPQMADMLEGAALKDLNFAAREIRKELNKQGLNFSVQSVPVIETYLSLAQAVKTLSGEKYTQISPSEKRYWNKLIRNVILELNKKMSI